jgi:hypothetical protein
MLLQVQPMQPHTTQVHSVQEQRVLVMVFSFCDL